MRGTIDALPYEVFIMCIAFAIDGQPAGPLEYIMVSKRWERLLLRTPSLWSQIYIHNGEDELSRISIFLHLSQKHSLHVDIITVLPNMDSLQLITENIFRVATISIRPGPSKTITCLYMEQWKRSASYILATLYNRLLPSLVLSDVGHSQCPGFSVRENDQWFFWVVFMQLAMRKHDPAQPVSVKSSEDWEYFHMWEEHITKTIGGSADQVARTSSLTLIAGFASYARCCDAIRIAIPAFVTLLKDESLSVQVDCINALDKFAVYVELRGSLRLALVEQFGHANIRIRSSVVPAFLKLVQDTDLRCSMMLSLLLELFDDPNLDTQMSTVSGLRKLAGYVKSNESLRVAISSLIERLRHVKAGTRKSAISVLKEMAAYDDFEEVLKVAILPLIELLGHWDPSIQTCAMSVMESLEKYGKFDKTLRAIILSLIKRLGDKDPAIRMSAISIVQSLDEYCEQSPYITETSLEHRCGAALGAAITSVVERLGDKELGIRTSTISVMQSLAEYALCHEKVGVTMPSITGRLRDKDPGIRTSAISLIQSLAKYDDFRAELRVAVPSIIGRLRDKDHSIRKSVVSVVQTLAYSKAFRAEFRFAIPSVVERLGDKDHGIRTSALSVVQVLAHSNDVHVELRVAIPSIIGRLRDKDYGIRTSAVSVIQSLTRYKAFRAEVGVAIPSVIERLGDKDHGIRTSAVSVVQILDGRKAFCAEFRVAIPSVIERLGEKDHGIRTSAVSVIQSLAQYNRFDAALRGAFPLVLERLGDSDPGIRSSAISVVQSLAKYNRFGAVLKGVAHKILEEADLGKLTGDLNGMGD